MSTLRSRAHLRAAAGFRGGALLADDARAFWTMTAWDDADSMRAYRDGLAHRRAMPRLMVWCDEASVVHWAQPGTTLPGWAEADRRMRAEGRASRVRHPSADHSGLMFKPPRAGDGLTIPPARAGRGAAVAAVALPRRGQT